MELIAAIKQRHSVRKYIDKPIEKEKVESGLTYKKIPAPTAVNQQKFKFILHEGNIVEAKTLFSMSGYTQIDLGIVKCHFEIGADKNNFTWK